MEHLAAVFFHAVNFFHFVLLLTPYVVHTVFKPDLYEGGPVYLGTRV